MTSCAASAKRRMKQQRKAETTTIEEGRERNARARVRSKVIIYSTSPTRTREPPQPKAYVCIRRSGRRRRTDGRTDADGRTDGRFFESSRLSSAASILCSPVLRSPAPRSAFSVRRIGDESIRYRNYISPRTHPPSPSTCLPTRRGSRTMRIGNTEISSQFFSLRIFFKIKSDVSLCSSSSSRHFAVGKGDRPSRLHVMV